MAYNTGMLKHRVTILNRTTSTTTKWGKDGGGVKYQEDGTVWASVDFVKGVRAMREGSIDVYGVVMVRMRYTPKINVRSRILYDGQVYQVLGETLHEDKQGNIVQFNAQVIIGESKPQSSSSLSGFNSEEEI